MIKEFNKFVNKSCELFGFDKEQFIKDIQNTTRSFLPPNIEKGNFDDCIYSKNDKYICQWYESLKKCKPDYSLYNSKFYLMSSWICHDLFSKGYLTIIARRKKEFKKPKVIIDFGCGLGFSSLKLQNIFKCKVYATNVKDSQQAVFNKEVFKDKVELVTDIRKLPKCDLAYCSEYFEHFENPIKHLKQILKLVTPKFFVFANSFNTIAVGHFNVYNGKSADETKELFQKALMNAGYVQLKQTWNNRPQIWKKNI